MNVTNCLLQLPPSLCWTLCALSPHSHHLTPWATTTPRWRKCQHLLRCDSFGLPSRSHVTTVENHCDWISDLTAGMVWLNGRGDTVNPLRTAAVEKPPSSSSVGACWFHSRTGDFQVSPSHFEPWSHRCGWNPRPRGPWKVETISEPDGDGKNILIYLSTC